MIKVDILEAKEYISFHRNATFIEGNRYFGRLSKTGDSYVVRSEEGEWTVIEDYRWAHNRFKVNDLFINKAVIHMKNRKRLNVFSSVDKYIDGKYARRGFYALEFYDIALYS